MSEKDKVVMRLEGKTVQDLRDEYYKVEDLIIDIISNKKNWLKVCDCPLGESSVFVYYDGENDEVVKVCINCGGNIEP